MDKCMFVISTDRLFNLFKIKYFINIDNRNDKYNYTRRIFSIGYS